MFDPIYWATYNDANIADKVAYSFAIADGIVTRESVMEIWDDLERNSVDFYAAMRSAYLQTAASPAVIMMKMLRERLLTTLTSALKTKT